MPSVCEKCPTRKRALDLTLLLITAPIWLLLLTVCAVALLMFEGRPIFYVSPRRVHGKAVIPVVKFRTMRRNVDTLVNRDTVPVSTRRFLNIAPDSPLYTATGRIIERCMFTELPQIIHILQGKMSLVGNRPLPVNVVESLRQEHPEVDRRFGAPAGLTGPVQLVGRDNISDSIQGCLCIPHTKMYRWKRRRLADNQESRTLHVCMQFVQLQMSDGTV